MMKKIPPLLNQDKIHIMEYTELNKSLRKQIKEIRKQHEETFMKKGSRTLTAEISNIPSWVSNSVSQTCVELYLI